VPLELPGWEAHHSIRQLWWWPILAFAALAALHPGTNKLPTSVTTFWFVVLGFGFWVELGDDR
jgi:hypothetical protein